MLHNISRGKRHLNGKGFRKRAVIAISALIFAVLSISWASPASAQGPCSGGTISGWYIDASAYPRSAFGVYDYGAAAQILQNSTTGQRVIRFRNLIANGKYNLLGVAGYNLYGNQYGQTGSIGTAPNGAWCSNVGPASTAIAGHLLYYIGSVRYDAQINT